MRTKQQRHGNGRDEERSAQRSGVNAHSGKTVIKSKEKIQGAPDIEDPQRRDRARPMAKSKGEPGECQCDQIPISGGRCEGEGERWIDHPWNEEGEANKAECMEK